jgi:hypothetical protein
MVFVAALVAPSLLAACTVEPNVRDAGSARHALDVAHESRSASDFRAWAPRSDSRASDARLSSPRGEGRSSRRDVRAR